MSPAHHRGPTSGGMCERCDAGKEPTANRASCALCGTVSAGSDGSCSVCAEGFEPNAERTACVACEVGFAGTGGECDQCLVGQEPSADRTTCQACPPYQYSPSGVCEPCVPPTLVVGDGTGCEIPVRCPGGYACPFVDANRERISRCGRGSCGDKAPCVQRHGHGPTAATTTTNAPAQVFRMHPVSRSQPAEWQVTMDPMMPMIWQRACHRALLQRQRGSCRSRRLRLPMDLRSSVRFPRSLVRHSSNTASVGLTNQSVLLLGLPFPICRIIAFRTCCVSSTSLILSVVRSSMRVDECRHAR